MSFLNRFKPAPTVRPRLNLGCLFDIPTGSYKIGKHGESILNGGLSPVTGIAGRGNMYKSTLGHFFTLRPMDRFFSAFANVYDTEESLDIERLEQLSTHLPYLSQEIPFQQEPDDNGEIKTRIMLSAKKSMPYGNEWFEAFRAAMKERKDYSNKQLHTTPFIDNKGNNIMMPAPVIGEIDSFSQMDVESHDKKLEANAIGEAGLNMEAMDAARAKSQMMMQMPGVTAMGGGYVILSAHVGDEHQLDPYSPPAKKLSFLKGKNKLKRVPENFTLLTNNLWFCFSANVLTNQTTKAPEFPRNSSDDMKGDTDLMKVTIQNLRAKSGPTGLPIDIIVSQREGVHVGLTEFWYLKENKPKGCVGFGIGGHDRSYYLELVPDVNMQRTTVRSKIDENPQVQRALEITSEICQMENLWHHMDRDLLLDPKDLYTTLKEKGYDWDLLLNTRGYWMLEEDIRKDTLPFLSTMDILKMAKGIYHPWWYDKVAKQTKKESTK